MPRAPSTVSTVGLRHPGGAPFETGDAARPILVNVVGFNGAMTVIRTEDKLIVIVEPTRSPAYDFDFAGWLMRLCRRNEFHVARRDRPTLDPLSAAKREPMLPPGEGMLGPTPAAPTLFSIRVESGSPG
jgi:hypothetical protein